MMTFPAVILAAKPGDSFSVQTKLFFDPREVERCQETSLLDDFVTATALRKENGWLLSFDAFEEPLQLCR